LLPLFAELKNINGMIRTVISPPKIHTPLPISANHARKTIEVLLYFIDELVETNLHLKKTL
jgi:hypothetical protein